MIQSVFEWLFSGWSYASHDMQTIAGILFSLIFFIALLDVLKFLLYYISGR